MPGKYVRKRVKKYNELDFKVAIESIARGLPIREASATFNIPSTTLNSYANNYVLHDRIGRPTKFTVDEELHLEQAAVALQVSESNINTVTSSFFSPRSNLGCSIVNQSDAQSCEDVCVFAQ